MIRKAVHQPPAMPQDKIQPQQNAVDRQPEVQFFICFPEVSHGLHHCRPAEAAALKKMMCKAPQDAFYT